MKKLNVWLIVASIVICCLNTVSVKAQCDSPDEFKVTNTNELHGLIAFNKRTKIVDVTTGKIIGFEVSAFVTAGHRKKGGCCQFNGGRCGRSSAALIKLITDLQGNITQSNTDIFVGSDGNGHRYIKYDLLLNEPDDN